MQAVDLLRGEAVAVDQDDSLVITLEQSAPSAIQVEHGAQAGGDVRHVPFRRTPISERHATGSLMYDGRSPRGFRVCVESFVILFRIRLRSVYAAFTQPATFVIFYVYSGQTTAGKVRTFIYKIIHNMVRCPILPGRDFTDPETLKSQLLNPDTATLQTLWDRLQTLVSPDRFLEIQMSLLRHGSSIQEDKRRLVDTYVGELFARERWEREQLERPWRPEMKRRQESAELEVPAYYKKLALSTQARLAKEREARERRAAARREKIEAEKRIEQEREAKQLLELVAGMQLRQEAASSLWGGSRARLASDRERRATEHREHMQQEMRIAEEREEREEKERREQYAKQALLRWGR